MGNIFFFTSSMVNGITDLNLKNFITIPQSLQAATHKFGYNVDHEVLELETTDTSKEFVAFTKTLSRSTDSIDEDTLLAAVVPLSSKLEIAEYEFENGVNDEFEKDLELFDYELNFNDESLDAVGLDDLPEGIEIDVFDTVYVDKDEVKIEPVEIILKEFEPDLLEALDIRPFHFKVNDNGGTAEFGRFDLKLDEDLVPEWFQDIFNKVLDQEVELAKPLLNQFNTLFEPLGIKILPKDDESKVEDNRIKIVLLDKQFPELSNDTFPLDELMLNFTNASNRDIDNNKTDHFRIRPFGDFQLNTDSKYINFEQLSKLLALDRIPAILNKKNGGFLSHKKTTTTSSSTTV